MECKYHSFLTLASRDDHVTDSRRYSKQSHAGARASWAWLEGRSSHAQLALAPAVDF